MSSIVSFRWHVPRGCCCLAVLPSTHLTFAEDEADPLHSLFSAVHNAALLIRMIRGWQRPKMERWQRLGNGFECCYCHTGLYHPMLNCCFYSSNMASTWLFLYFFSSSSQSILLRTSRLQPWHGKLYGCMQHNFTFLHPSPIFYFNNLEIRPSRNFSGNTNFSILKILIHFNGRTYFCSLSHP